MHSGKYTLLLIDDDADAVRAVSHLLRDRFRVLTAVGPAQALDLLGRNDVHLILCGGRIGTRTGATRTGAQLDENGDGRERRRSQGRRFDHLPRPAPDRDAGGPARRPVSHPIPGTPPGGTAAGVARTSGGHPRPGVLHKCQKNLVDSMRGSAILNH